MTYLVKSLVLSAAGDNTDRNFCSYKAGINTYQSANYHTQDHRQITLALVPDGALPPLTDAIEQLELSYRDQRLLQMVARAGGDILAQYRGEPIPLILAGPENHPGLDRQLPRNFFALLQHQIDLPILYSASRTYSTGRTGMLEAIRQAQSYLASGNYEQVLVGGVDTCQHSDWLHLLDSSGRLKSESLTGAGDTFVPGEGAVFLLLSNDPVLALTQHNQRIILSAPGFGEEPGHIYSNQSYQGQGLDSAVKAVLAQLPDQLQIDMIFSSMNGEHYWAKELGVAMTRSSHSFKNTRREHPADCYGDLGAAAGGALIALAAEFSIRNPASGNCLICTSSDNPYRAAIAVIAERVAP